jgi:thiamine-monophosphate kinase
METQFIQWLRSQVPQHPRIPLGIGDDAAVLDLASGRQWVVTTDMLMDGVDFHVGQHDPALIGRKSLAVNLSDLAAMGARPVACFVSVALPRQGGEALARQIYEGLFALARQFDTAIAGGDTNSWDGKLVINVTAVGEIEFGKAWKRSGAQAGDQVLVTGEFGGSILGRHFEFTPRVADAEWLATNAKVNAAIDVSDGLSLDLSRICQESGCGAVLDLEAIPISPLARQLATKERGERSALEHALCDGEDFELILAVSSEEAERLLAIQPLATRLTRIGQFVTEPGLWSQAADGARAALTPRGYEHRLDP